MNKISTPNISIVRLLHFKISLWMNASRTSKWSLFCLDDESAVAALPEHLSILLEHNMFLDVLQQSEVALFVSLLCD
jgi:hypothetical protein